MGWVGLGLFGDRYYSPCTVAVDKGKVLVTLPDHDESEGSAASGSQWSTNIAQNSQPGARVNSFADPAGSEKRKPSPLQPTRYLR